MRLLSLLLLTACNGAVKRDFQTSWDGVMSPPAALPTDWQPDATVRLAHEAVQRGLVAAMDQADLDAMIDLRGARFEPELLGTRLRLGTPPRTCKDCLTLDGEVLGRVRYKLAGIAAGTFEARAGLVLDTRVEAGVTDQGHDLHLSLADIRRVQFDLGTKQRIVAELAQQPLTDWLRTELTGLLPDIRVARFGTDALPLRDLRLRADDGTLLLSLRTDSPDLAATTGPAPPVSSGWSARVSVDSVLAIARREAFEAGPLTYGVYADPRALVVEDGAFTLTLRLWRPKGGAWWRDYEIDGDVRFRRGRVELEAFEAVEVGHSPGAGTVDPLALLAKGRILDALVDSVNASIPASRAQDIGGVRTSWKLGTLDQDGDDLVLTGKVSFSGIAR
jgi:hypothetical protein